MAGSLSEQSLWCSSTRIFILCSSKACSFSEKRVVTESSDCRIFIPNLNSCKNKTWKNSGLDETRTHDRCAGYQYNTLLTFSRLSRSPVWRPSWWVMILFKPVPFIRFLHENKIYLVVSPPCLRRLQRYFFPWFQEELNTAKLQTWSSLPWKQRAWRD